MKIINLVHLKICHSLKPRDILRVKMVSLCPDLVRSIAENVKLNLTKYIIYSRIYSLQFFIFSVKFV